MASSQRYAELHLHLEGCLDPATLMEIAPGLTREAINTRMHFSNFAGFIETFKFAVQHLETPVHYRLLVRRALASLEDQGIVYVEMIHSAGVCLWRKQDARAILEAILEEGQRSTVELRWILDGVRHFGGDHSLAVARLAVEYANHGVVGFGVGGDETGCPAEDLRPAFQLAKEHGLKLVPHAGETSNAQNVWDALALGADRIGHGIRAIEDPRLLDHLAKHQIPLEISLTSNVKTGAVSGLEAHPLPRLVEAGVPVVLNTDDPAFFETTLATEFEKAALLGLTPIQLEEIRLNAFRFAAAKPSNA